MSGTSKLKSEEVSEKKQVLAGKMKGGNPEDRFSAKDRKKIKKTYKEDNGKEPKSSWTT